jgi:hypothetical protein
MATSTPLPLNTDFTTLDFTQAPASQITPDPTYATVPGTNIAYQAANGTTNPTGKWVVGNQQVTAHGIVMGKFYQGYLSANSTLQSQLSAMNTNTVFANASSAFSASLQKDSASMHSDDTRSYSSLVSLVQNDSSINLAALNMTAAQFVSTVLPNESTTASYTQTTYNSLVASVNQFTNAKVTNNSVLQIKLDNANANMNNIVTAMSGLITSQIIFANTLVKDIV